MPAPLWRRAALLLAALQLLVWMLAAPSLVHPHGGTRWMASSGAAVGVVAASNSRNPHANSYHIHSDLLPHPPSDDGGWGDNQGDMSKVYPSSQGSFQSQRPSSDSFTSARRPAGQHPMTSGSHFGTGYQGTRRGSFVSQHSAEDDDVRPHRNGEGKSPASAYTTMIDNFMRQLRRVVKKGVGKLFLGGFISQFEEAFMQPDFEAIVDGLHPEDIAAAVVDSLILPLLRSANKFHEQKGSYEANLQPAVRKAIAVGTILMDHPEFQSLMTDVAGPAFEHLLRIEQNAHHARARAGQRDKTKAQTQTEAKANDPTETQANAKAGVGKEAHRRAGTDTDAGSDTNSYRSREEESFAPADDGSDQLPSFLRHRVAHRHLVAVDHWIATFVAPALGGRIAAFSQTGSADGGVAELAEEMRRWFGFVSQSQTKYVLDSELRTSMPLVAQSAVAAAAGAVWEAYAPTTDPDDPLIRARPGKALWQQMQFYDGVFNAAVMKPAVRAIESWFEAANKKHGGYALAWETGLSRTARAAREAFDWYAVSDTKKTLDHLNVPPEHWISLLQHYPKVAPRGATIPLKERQVVFDGFVSTIAPIFEKLKQDDQRLFPLLSNPLQQWYNGMATMLHSGAFKQHPAVGLVLADVIRNAWEEASKAKETYSAHNHIPLAQSLVAMATPDPAAYNMLMQTLSMTVEVMASFIPTYVAQGELTLALHRAAHDMGRIPSMLAVTKSDDILQSVPQQVLNHKNAIESYLGIDQSPNTFSVDDFDRLVGWLRPKDLNDELKAPQKVTRMSRIKMKLSRHPVKRLR